MRLIPLLQVEAAAYQLDAGGFFVEPDAALAELLLGPGQPAERLQTMKLSEFFANSRSRDAFQARVRRAGGQRLMDHVMLRLPSATLRYQCVEVWHGDEGAERYSGLLIRSDPEDERQMMKRPAPLVGSAWRAAQSAPSRAIESRRARGMRDGGGPPGSPTSAPSWERAEEWQRSLKFALDLWLIQHKRHHPDSPQGRVQPTGDALALQARLDVLRLREQALRFDYFERSIAEAVAARSKLEAAAYYRYDVWSGNLILRAERGLPPGIHLPRHISPDVALSTGALISEPLLDLESWPHYWGPKETAGQELVPMIVDGRQLGCVWTPIVEGMPRDGWLPAFCEFLCAVIPGAEREAAERARERALAEAVTILLTGEPSLFYARFLALLMGELNVEAGSIFTVQAGGNEPRLVLAESSGIVDVPPSRWREVTYRLRDGLTGAMAQTKEPIVLLDVEAERARRGLGAPRWAEVTPSAPKGWLGCPVLSREKELVAYVRLVNRRVGDGPAGRFSDGDVVVARTMASVIAQFHELQARQRRNQERITRAFHDLAAPVTAIRHHAAWLENKLDHPHAPAACKNIRMDAELLQDLLDAIRFASRNDEPRPQWTLLYKHIIVPMVFGLRELARRYGYRSLEINTNQLQHLPAIHVDRAMIRQVFYNLVVNAIKYGHDDEGGVLVIEIAGQVRNKRIQIAVRDHGIGIDEEDEDKIFREYYRGAEAIRCDPTGSGIGLFVAQRVLEKHGGSIRVGNRRNPTEFVLVLPMEAGR